MSKMERLCSLQLRYLALMFEPRLEEDRGIFSRIHDLQGDKKLLFISYKAGHKGDIHKKKVSSWVRKLLYFAYTKALEDVIRLSSAHYHEVRALASSMGFRGSIELEEVLCACTR